MRRHPTIEPILVHTGQHYDEALSDVFFHELDIPAPDFNLEVGSGSHAVQTAEVLRRIEPILIEHRPDLVVVVGDVNSTVAVSLAAAKLGIPVAHVEAGLRSFDRSMPEEINRVLTDAIADYLLVTEEDGIENLRREGRPETSIHFVGNLMIDSLRRLLPLAQKSQIGQRLGLRTGEKWSQFAVLTLHRPSNVDSEEKFARLIDSIDAVSEHIPVVFPVHPRTRQRLNSRHIRNGSRIRTIPPVGYLDFLCLLDKATVVLTDSGGIQEETTALGVPCLTLRENTERPVTVSEGTNILVGTDPARILRATLDILAGKTKVGGIPRLWDGRTAGRIVDVLRRSLAGEEALAVSQ
jgi:UDP-N-acetylglucosamine 2-epimerase (non-hydrolysing)